MQAWMPSKLGIKHRVLQGYFGDDCSNEAVHLQYGVPVAKEAENFE